MNDPETTNSHQGESRSRARDLGIRIGRLSPGPWNAITDVAGIRVGHETLIRGEGPLVVGEGPVRTGVTVIIPHEGQIATDPLFAAIHVLNGNGEMTGSHWIRESGLLTTPIAITNTHSVGTVHESLIAYNVEHGKGNFQSAWSLPVVSETYDGILSDIDGLHVKREHVYAALESAASGPVAEGNTGGGTGMICHGFKGGIGTSSRVVADRHGGWTVGALVQANYGQRHLFRVDGVPVGKEIPVEEVPGPHIPSGAGSIIVIVATDAPLLPGQCQRLAQRATLGVARAGGLGEDSSGDIFLAFATGNRNLLPSGNPGTPVPLRMLQNVAMTPLFEAVAEAVEEAILNALCAATTMTGVDGRVVRALPLDRLREVMKKYHSLGS